MLKTILIGTIILACASIAAAQSDYKKFEFFTGYSHNRVDTGIGNDDPDLGQGKNRRGRPCARAGGFDPDDTARP